MAETLLIAFVICILIGMPISIAMGVGALTAAVFYPALNPIIIPTRFVGLLSDSYLLLSAPLFILAGNIAAPSAPTPIAMLIGMPIRMQMTKTIRRVSAIGSSTRQ